MTYTVLSRSSTYQRWSVSRTTATSAPPSFYTYKYLVHLDRTFGSLAIFPLAYLNSMVTFTECVQLSGFWKQLGTQSEGVLYVTNRLKYICLSACWRYNLCAPCWSKTTIKTYNSFRTRQDGVWLGQISRQSTEELLRWKRNM